MNDDIGNDMDKLAERTAFSQAAINDLADFVARGQRAQAAVDATIKQVVPIEKPPKVDKPR